MCLRHLELLEEVRSMAPSSPEPLEPLEPLKEPRRYVPPLRSPAAVPEDGTYDMLMGLFEAKVRQKA